MMKSTITLLLFCISLIGAHIHAAPSMTTGRYQVSDLHADNHGQAHKDTHAREWIVWKTANMTEIQQINAPFSVVWIKLNSGAYQRKEVHHAFKTVVNYEPGDAHAMGLTESWKAHASLFEAGLLEKLTPRGEQVFGDATAMVYEGKLYGRDYKVLWLPEAGLPAQIEIRGPKAGERITLIEWFPDENAAYSRVDWQNEYGDIDYVDIGDNEAHPLVQSMHTTGSEGYQYPGHKH